LSSFVANLVRRAVGLPGVAIKPSASREAGPVAPGADVTSLSTDHSTISLDGGLESVSTELTCPDRSARPSLPDGMQLAASVPARHEKADRDGSNSTGDAMVGSNQTATEAIAPALGTARPVSREGRDLASRMAPRPKRGEDVISEREQSLPSVRKPEVLSKQTAEASDHPPQPTLVAARGAEAILPLTKPGSRVASSAKPVYKNIPPAGIDAAEPEAHSAYAEPGLMEIPTPPLDDELNYDLRRPDRGMVLPRIAETSAQSIAVIAAQAAGEHSSVSGIHVRIGQVEVQVNRAQQPRPPVRLTSGRPRGGFQKFFRTRNYLR